MAGAPPKCGKRLSRYSGRYSVAALLRLIGAQRKSRAGGRAKEGDAVAHFRNPDWQPFLSGTRKPETRLLERR